MYRTLVILCLVAPAFGLFLQDSGPVRGGLKYKLGPPGSDSIINIPLSNISASVRGYDLMNRPRLPGGYCPLQLWCRKDNLFSTCLFTDETGDVAGVQINIPCSDFKPRFDMREQGFTIWTTTLDNQIVRFYAFFVFFVPPDSQKRIKSKDVTVVLRDKNLYYSGFGGYLASVTTNTRQLQHDRNYVKQECVTFQGFGHYYNMTEDLECSASTLSPFSVSVYRDTLVAAKVTAFGHFKKYSKYFKLFEDVNAVGAKHDVPTGPACMFTHISQYGAISMTIFFISTPYNIRCLKQQQQQDEIGHYHTPPNKQQQQHDEIRHYHTPPNKQQQQYDEIRHYHTPPNKQQQQQD